MGAQKNLTHSRITTEFGLNQCIKAAVALFTSRKVSRLLVICDNSVARKHGTNVVRDLSLRAQSSAEVFWDIAETYVSNPPRRHTG